MDGALFDADHDGDLDLFLVNGDGPNELLNNNRDGTFMPIAKELGIDGRSQRGQSVLVADLDRVHVLCDGKAVADHERVWAWHQTITDPEHREVANLLRRNKIGLRPIPAEDTAAVEQRALSDYDAALGIDLGEGGFAS